MPALLLRPNDVVFFRDGRPMGGASSGHGAAWPLPHVLNAALHAALHRAFVGRADDQGNPVVRVGRSHAPASRDGKGRVYGDKDGPLRHFTDFWSAGPFPVNSGRWFFPRPADAQANGSAQPTHQPFVPTDGNTWLGSSLPKPLCYPVANLIPPSKQKATAWFSRTAWDAYLRIDATPLSTTSASPTAADFAADDDFADTEHSIGIGIDPDTQTTGSGDAEGQFYSAHYLRLRDDAHDKVRLGLLAGDTDGGRTIAELFPGDRGHIIVGGQQRVCDVEVRPAEEPLPLPRGITDPALLTRNRSGDYLVKWVLLSPAVWPVVPDKANDSQTHRGGWLPNWINASSGEVQLRLPPPRQPKQSRLAWRNSDRQPLAGRLVAALVPKALALTGWSLGDQLANPADPRFGGRAGGPKSTHLAVPAGAVYYFLVPAAREPDPAAAARQFLAAMNWHGATAGSEIKNRRSTAITE